MLEATDIQNENKVAKLNVNKHLFCVKKGKMCNIFSNLFNENFKNFVII